MINELIELILKRFVEIYPTVYDEIKERLRFLESKIKAHIYQQCTNYKEDLSYLKNQKI